MARYTPELLASLKQAYEDTDEPMQSIADRHEIGITTLQTLVRRGGWAKRSQRLRERPASAVLYEESERPIATLPPPAEHAIDAEDEPGEDAGEDIAATCAPEASAEGGPPPSPAARLEALIVRQIAAEEAVRADLDAVRRMRGGADRCARTLVILGQALAVVQKLRAEEPPALDPDDMPRDIDEFREALARGSRLSSRRIPTLSNVGTMWRTKRNRTSNRGRRTSCNGGRESRFPRLPFL